MSDPRRPPLLSPRALLRELVFLVRMRASERRFQRHREAWRRHQVATNKRLDGMAAEVEFRAGLCERNALARTGRLMSRPAIMSENPSGPNVQDRPGGMISGRG